MNKFHNNIINIFKTYSSNGIIKCNFHKLISKRFCSVFVTTRKFSSSPQVILDQWYQGQHIDPSAKIHPSSKIEPKVVVQQNAQIGPNCLIGAGTIVGPNTIIGGNAVIENNVSLNNCTIGNNVHIKSGASIGQDGFGWVIGSSDTGHTKKPHPMRVIIGDNVQIGANTTIDRGSWRDTTIGSGTKLDNLIQIAHNVQIGRNCIICAQCGIAGSVTIGNFVIIGGQTGVKDHISIGNNVKIAAKSGVTSSLSEDMDYGGIPAIPIKKWRKLIALQHKLEKR